jgi:hypothetical protein
MNENAFYILNRLSQREWLRVQALGFPVPERGRIAIAKLLARSGEREKPRRVPRRVTDRPPKTAGPADTGPAEEN